MVWVLFGIVTFLVIAYFKKGKQSDFTLPTEEVDQFIVTAILSTLCAHGILTLTQKEELESLSLDEIGGILTEEGHLQPDDWEWFVSDHIETGNMYYVHHDLDLG